MKIPFVDLHAQYKTIKSEIDEAIETVIRDSAFVSGPYVEKFEDEFAKTIGTKHCVSCANGTDALYIAMKGLGLYPGDEVITTAHSWIATSETVTQAGGKVVFCDTEKGTFNIDHRLIEEKITTKTVGIIPVHLYGQPADMDPILEIAKRHNLWVLEDCAQAHLAEYKGRKVGTMGNAGTFSFYPGKNLAAMGDAGCIVTNDDRLAEWSALYARHGGKGSHIIEGTNSRMDGMQAAILSAKLPHLPEWTAKRREVAAIYNKLLGGRNGLQTPEVRQDRSHVYHLYVIRVKDRDLIKELLNDKGVSTVINYSKALPFYEAYKHLKHKPTDFPVAHKNQSKILSIPIYPEINHTTQDYITKIINSFLETYANG